MDTLRESIRVALGDDYVIERELGGGMSCVFVAQDRALERRVVIKVLHPQLAASVSVERFRREILTIAALQHPHIVPVLATGNVDGLPYYVMPFVEGESLAQHLHAGRMPVRETVGVLKDVARALAVAHARGIVHRDIKPGNVLLADGTAVVTDFGVAKALTSARRSTPDAQWGLTTAGTSLGTLLYMAPEQAAADPDIDGRADIYALGVTAYEMLTGSPPFAGLPARAMLAARMSAQPPSVASVRHGVPLALSDLIQRCLASDPADRPQTAQELVDALDAPNLLSDDHSTGPRRAYGAPRKRTLIGLGATAMLGVVIATAYTHTGERITAAPPSAAAMAHSEVAVVPFVDLGGAADASLAEGITNAVAGNLSKSGHLRVVSPSVAETIVRQMRSGTATGAQLVLEGTVQRENGRLRVTARLSNASDGVMRWADVFDRDGKDLFAVTDDIAAAIVASVGNPKG